MSAQTQSRDRNFAIRPATLVDAEPIAILLRHVWAHTFAYYISAEGIEKDVMPMFTLERVRHHLSNIDDRWYVAVSTTTGPHEILGVAQIKLDYPLLPSVDPRITRKTIKPAYLARLFVHPSQCGSGLAPTLLLATEDAARRVVWLVVLQQNAKAVRFYQRLGYVRIGEKEHKEEWFPHVSEMMHKRFELDAHAE